MQIVKRWVLHSLAQNIINLFPKNISYKIYFYVQRKFGRIYNIDSINYLKRALLLFDYIKKYNLSSEKILELGTGRTVTTLIGLWILGIKKMITIDLNPYLSEELTKRSICQIIEHSDKVFSLYRDYLSEKEFNDKIENLSKFVNLSLEKILESLNIQYFPNQDARDLNFINNNSIDIYFSDQVLEHIPYQTIKLILNESKKILSEKGTLIHFIGLHDHFATIDTTISKINFLKYNKFVWHILAGNKFMYHNRLRSPDYFNLFTKQGFQIVKKDVYVDKRSLLLLENKFKLNNTFKKYKPEDLATTSITLICKR